MKTVRYYGKILIKDEWIKIDPEKATVELPDETEPFEYFQMATGAEHYLITYKIIKE